jgi:hypothetical protein
MIVSIAWLHLLHFEKKERVTLSDGPTWTDGSEYDGHGIRMMDGQEFVHTMDTEYDGHGLHDGHGVCPYRWTRRTRNIRRTQSTSYYDGRSTLDEDHAVGVKYE